MLDVNIDCVFSSFFLFLFPVKLYCTALSTVSMDLSHTRFCYYIIITIVIVLVFFFLLLLLHWRTNSWGLCEETRLMLLGPRVLKTGWRGLTGVLPAFPFLARIWLYDYLFVGKAAHDRRTPKPNDHQRCWSPVRQGFLRESHVLSLPMVPQLSPLIVKLVGENATAIWKAATRHEPCLDIVTCQPGLGGSLHTAPVGLCPSSSTRSWDVSTDWLWLY